MTTQHDIAQWYDRRHREKGESAWRPYDAYPVFLNHLGVPAHSGGRLLDVGCGTGHLLRAAEERGLTTAGVDISEEALRIARRNAPRSRVQRVTDESLPFEDGMFDFVTCLGVLEHFIDMERGLLEMIRVARPGARFCIMVPNSRFLLWLLKGTPGTEQQDINEHLLSMDEWRRLFERSGLREVAVRADRWRMRGRGPGAAGPLKVLTAMVLRLAWILLPLRWTYQFVFILEKPGGNAAPDSRK